MQLQKSNGIFLLLAAAAAILVVIVVLLAAPSAIAGPGAAQATDLSWNVVASGGAAMSSASYQIVGTAGQPAAGPLSSSSYSLFSGYWQDLGEAVNQLLLPLLTRQ